MVSSPETGSDSPIGSDRESGRDNLSHALRTLSDIYLGDVCFFHLMLNRTFFELNAE